MKDSSITDGEVPMGFGMAMAGNLKAMKYFSGLPKPEQERIIEQTKTISSKQEMQSFVGNLAGNFESPQ